MPGIDSTALLSFSKIQQLGEAQGLVLVFTQLAPNIRRQFDKALLHGEGAPNVRIFPDLDRGLEWKHSSGELQPSGGRLRRNRQP